MPTNHISEAFRIEFAAVVVCQAFSGCPSKIELGDPLPADLDPSPGRLNGRLHCRLLRSSSIYPVPKTKPAERLAKLHIGASANPWFKESGGQIHLRLPDSAEVPVGRLVSPGVQRVPCFAGLAGVIFSRKKKRFPPMSLKPLSPGAQPDSSNQA